MTQPQFTFRRTSQHLHAQLINEGGWKKLFDLQQEYLPPTEQPCFVIKLGASSTLAFKQEAFLAGTVFPKPTSMTYSSMPGIAPGVFRINEAELPPGLPKMYAIEEFTQELNRSRQTARSSARMESTASMLIPELPFNKQVIAFKPVITRGQKLTKLNYEGVNLTDTDVWSDPNLVLSLTDVFYKSLFEVTSRAGNLGTITGWQCNPYLLPSVNILLAGGMRIWNIILPEDYNKFRELVKNTLPPQPCPAILEHQTHHFSIQFIQDAGIKFVTIVQKPGDLIAVYEKSWFHVTDLGHNINQDQVFISKHWLNEVCNDYEDYCVCPSGIKKPPTVRSLDVLLGAYKRGQNAAKHKKIDTIVQSSANQSLLLPGSHALAQSSAAAEEKAVQEHTTTENEEGNHLHDEFYPADDILDEQIDQPQNDSTSAPQNDAPAEETAQQPRRKRVRNDLYKPDQPFKCSKPFCDYKSSWKANVTRHEKTHTEKRTVKCNQCRAKFLDEASVLGHKAKVHLINPVSCRSCLFIAPNPYKHHQHMVRKHPEQLHHITCPVCKKEIVHPHTLSRHQCA